MLNKNKNFSEVKVVGIENPILIPITASNKPKITDEILENWQNIIDTTAKLLHIPASLIMKLDTDNIKVFLSSNSNGNPYHQYESEHLQIGLYCETVVGNRSPLLVPNALSDENWKHNPDVKLNMISYYGLPIIWPDGEIFGTFCVLDNKENKYSPEFLELIRLFKNVIENDLKIILEKNELSIQNRSKDLIIQEIHHRVKNHFNLIISLIHLKKNNSKNLSEDELKRILSDIESKIAGMVDFHERISSSKDLSNISIKEYITALIKNICSVFDRPEIKINVEVEKGDDDVFLKEKYLIPLGLLVNELVTNSIKHAFNDTINPEINFKIKQNQENNFDVTYSDNGIGFPKGFKFKNSESLGGIIIDGLANQIGDGIQVKLNGKTAICFNIIHKQAI